MTIRFFFFFLDFLHFRVNWKRRKLLSPHPRCVWEAVNQHYKSLEKTVLGQWLQTFLALWLNRTFFFSTIVLITYFLEMERERTVLTEVLRNLKRTSLTFYPNRLSLSMGENFCSIDIECNALIVSDCNNLYFCFILTDEIFGKRPIFFRDPDKSILSLLFLLTQG